MHRTVRAVLATALAGPAFALTAATDAQAHGDTLTVEITGHDFGRVRTTVVWENDNDPVDGRVAATVNATAADGRTAGPWKLVRDPATRTGWNTAEALPPGRWKVTVEAGHPGLGRDEEEITVSPGTPASPAAPPAGTGSEVPATPGTAPPTAGERTRHRPRPGPPSPPRTGPRPRPPRVPSPPRPGCPPRRRWWAVCCWPVPPGRSSPCARGADAGDAPGSCAAPRRATPVRRGTTTSVTASLPAVGCLGCSSRTAARPAGRTRCAVSRSR